MCTIASMPRLPEHCIEYVRMLLWPKETPFGGIKTLLKLPWNITDPRWVAKPVNEKSKLLFWFVCVWVRWCGPGWGWPKAHPVGVPEISGEGSRVQHYRSHIQTYTGWAYTPICQLQNSATFPYPLLCPSVPLGDEPKYTKQSKLLPS